jgi:hypothetical protein
MQPEMSLRLLMRLLPTLLLGCAFVFPATATEFKFLRPNDPELRNFQPNEPIIIRLPEGISEGELGNLYLELNGVDITQLVSLEGRDVIFSPASPQNPGAHALRLVKMGRNGKIVELSRWNFNVAGQAEMPGGSNIQGSADVTYSYLAARDEGLDDGADRHQMHGKLKLKGSAQKGSWLFGGNLNGFASSDDDNNPAQDYVEIGDYLLSAERLSDTLSADLKLGQHKIDANNILVRNFNRRGASASIGVNGEQAVITGFAQNPQRSFGNDNFTGLQEQEQRLTGVNARVQPIASWGRKLELESTVYRGEGNVFGAGTGVPDVSEDVGSGYQFGLKSDLIEDKLSLRAQYANSRYDFDGSGTVIGPEDDRAYTASLTYAPLESGVTADGKVRKWTLEFSYSNTGSYFRSMANSLLEADRDRYALKSSLLYGNLLLDSEIAWLTDNVNDISTLPREGALNAWFDGSYAPEKAMWGQPIFTFGGKLSDESRQDTPIGYTGPDLDRVSGSLTGGVTMSHAGLMWSLSHTYARLKDHETDSNTYGSHFTDLTFEYQATNWLTLRPGVQYEYLDENADGASHAWHASLGTETVLLTDTLYNTSNISALLNSGETVAGDEFTFDTDFTWQIRPAVLNKVGYAISVYGAYSSIEADSTTDSTDDARLFLRLKLSSPFSF